MCYFHIIQMSQIAQIQKKNDEITIDIAVERFLEYTTEDIRLLYKPIQQDRLELLKNYPAIITIEQFSQELILGKILEIHYSENIKLTIKLKQLDSYSIALDTDAKQHSTLIRLLKFEMLEQYRQHWAIKKGNFFEIVQDSILTQFSSFKQCFPNISTPLPVTQNIQPNSISFGSTVHVELNTSPKSRLAPFLNQIIEINNKIKTTNPRREIFYRGHSDESYKLIPSIFREYKGNQKFYEELEHYAFRELLSMEPKSFINDNFCFDILTRMQHYALPTRLLDISSNPLTALYFACTSEDKKDNNGEVIILSIVKDDINYFDSDKVSCIANLVKLKYQQKNKLFELIQSDKEAILSDNEFDTNVDYYQLIHFIRQEKPYFQPTIKASDLSSILCVKGRLNQDRIIAQAGSFLLYGLESTLSKEGNDSIKVDKITIKKEDKQYLLDELDILGINERTIYPSIENSSKYIKRRLELGI